MTDESITTNRCSHPHGIALDPYSHLLPVIRIQTTTSPNTPLERSYPVCVSTSTHAPTQASRTRFRASSGHLGWRQCDGDECGQVVEVVAKATVGQEVSIGASTPQCSLSLGPGVVILLVLMMIDQRLRPLPLASLIMKTLQEEGQTDSPSPNVRR